MTLDDDRLLPSYQEGYDAALVPPPNQPKNPYPYRSKSWDAWSLGYGEATDDYIRHKGGEFD